MILFQEYKEMVHEIRNFYFDDNDVSIETIQEYVDMMSDLFFVYNTRHMVGLHGETSNKNTYLLR